MDVTKARSRLLEPFQTFAQVFRNPDLRRLELAWAASVTGEWSSIVALSVFAYDAGGTAAVGLVVLIRMLPSAVVAPFAALLGDRFPRKRVMVAADLVRAVAVAAAAAAVFADAPAGVVFALAGVVALVSTAFRPAQVALLPALARDPRSSPPRTSPRRPWRASRSSPARRWAGSSSSPRVQASSSPRKPRFLLLSAFLLGGIRADERKRKPVALESGRGIAGRRLPASGPSAPTLACGSSSVSSAAQTLVAGALNVLIVVTAIELLDLGPSGVGFLASADGVGGLVGAVVALALVGSRRLGRASGSGSCSGARQ